MTLYLLRGRDVQPRYVVARRTDSLLMKAQPIPAGARWITVHPDGKDEPGHPVLIRESTTHPGTYHVIGGAGGKLNHMRLTNVDPSKWKANRAAKLKEKRAKLGSLRAGGKKDSVDSAESELKEAAKRNQIGFVNTIADKMGWDKGWYKDASDFEGEGMEPTAAKIAANAHLRAHVSKAKEAVENLTQKLRRDHDARTSAGLGNLALDSNPYHATPRELDPDALKGEIEDHADRAAEASERAAKERDRTAKAFDAMADALTPSGADPDDEGEVDPADIDVPADIPVPAARDLLEATKRGEVGPQHAARELRKIAADVRDGKIDLADDIRADSHGQVADLYRQALDAKNDGDDAAAARHVEQAKKLAGDRSVTALDLIGEQASGGKGYRPVVKRRAVGDVIASGDTAPEALAQRRQAVEAQIRSAEVPRQVGDDFGVAVGVLDSLTRERAAILKAQEAQAAGDPKAAAEHYLEADQFVVKRAKNEDRELKGQRAVVAMAKKMRESHAAVRAGKDAGTVGAPDVDTDVKTMAGARDMVLAQQQFRENEANIKEARGLLTEDPELARQSLRDSQRADFAEHSPEEEQRILEKELRRGLDTDSIAAHNNLLNRLEDADYFADRGGGAQVSAGALARYVAQGQDAVLNLFGQVAQAGATIDRSIMDQIGVKASARLIADHLANQLTPEELKGIRSGLEAYHVARGRDVAEGALVACDEALEQAKAFEAAGGGADQDISVMERYNRLRLDAVGRAMSSVGVAHGELNMTAELIWALGEAQRSDGSLTIRPDRNDDQSLVNLARSFGLREGEFNLYPSKVKRDGTVEQEGHLRIAPDAAHKVVVPQSPERQRRGIEMDAIRRGLRDDDDPNWLPAGFARRSIDTWGDSQKRPDRYGFTEGLLHNALRDGQGDTNAQADAFARYARGKLDEGVPPEELPGRMRTTFDQAVAAGHVAPDADILDRAHGLIGAVSGRPNTGDVQSQRVMRTPAAIEAIHRAIATNPNTALAFKGIGDLSASDRKFLRHYYLDHLAPPSSPAERKAMKEAPNLDEGEADFDQWGNPLPETQSTQEGPGDERWDRYQSAMGRPEYGYTMIQEHLKDQAIRAFQQHYNGTHDEGQHLAVAERANQFMPLHYLATMPKEERDRFNQNAVGGNFEQQVRNHYLGGGFAGAPNPERQFATLGERGDKQLAAMWGGVADNFTPGRPVKLMKDLRMSGRYVNQQRAIKAIRRLKRVALALGVGSGKTNVMLGGFADAHHHGEARKGLMAVPKNMVGQFGAEAASSIDPNSGIKWHAKPGADAKERARGMGGNHHITVMSHQSLRDDTVKAIAEHEFGGDTKRAEEAMLTLPPPVRAAMVQRAFKAKGWDHRLDYVAMDEGHQGLNREGKENSLLANVLDAIGDSAHHYTWATGTPVKNDVSEAYDVLRKIAPDEHPESGREDFVRAHGGIMQQVNRIAVHRRGQEAGQNDWSRLAIAEAMQRRMAPYVFAARVPLETTLHERNERVALTPGHRRRYDRVTELYNKAAQARSRGSHDLAALKELSPNTFEGSPPEDHEQLARGLGPSLGMLREFAYNRALHASEGRGGNSKHEAVAKLVKEYSQMPSQRTGKDGQPKKGRATITFTGLIDGAHQLKARLEQDGHRVGLITGETPSEEAERTKLAFQPSNWKTHGDRDATIDHLICTNAVSAGADMPRTEAIIHHDIPMTAMVHEQRTARAHRLSNDVDVDMVNLASDTPHEMGNQARLEGKYALADVGQNPAEAMDDTGMQHYVGQQRVAQEVGAAARRIQQRALAQQGGGSLSERARRIHEAGGGIAQMQRELGVGFNTAVSFKDQFDRERQPRQATGTEGIDPVGDLSALKPEGGDSGAIRRRIGRKP